MALKRSLGIVIPTFDRLPDLRRTLRSLAAQRCDPETFEVVVADDGSSERTMTVIKEYEDQLNLRYIYQRDDGFRAAAARNSGAALINAPLLAFLDHGVIAGPEYVNRVLAVFARSDRAPALLGYEYGYDPWNPFPELLPLLDRLPPEEAIRGQSPRRIRDARHERFGLPPDLPVDPDPPGDGLMDLSHLAAPWDLHWSGNLVLAAEDFWAVGGFADDYCTWGGEDIELGYRIWLRGVPHLMSRGAWGIETPRESRDTQVNRRAIYRNMVNFWRKHQDPAGELVWALYAQWFTAATINANTTIEREMRALNAWRARSREQDVLPELERADIAACSRSVAVFGSGARLPEEWTRRGLRCAALDFDPELAAAVGGRHAIGARTSFEVGEFDQVLLTSRMSGLSPFLRELAMEEAGRIGDQVEFLGVGERATGAHA
jgi:validoxylamine A glucosyltransferase